MLLLTTCIDIDGADGGNIGCKLMSDVPTNEDRFIDLIVNGTFFALHAFLCAVNSQCISLSLSLSLSR